MPDMNQPNLQAILKQYSFAVQDLIAGHTPFDDTKDANRWSGEAIDAIYAGLLAAVVGGGYPISAISSGNSAMQNTIELQAMDKLREAQRIALKRWCYGETK